ncbi:hypothetical protein GGR06_000437 [Bacteroides reticulotermitis]|uniref:Uncharacterized protein n=1 Tax=Bacteroides reticulotermitis TaxID=1133319 RepID=A0A840CX40_9BACE|nr:hypothetical protein [Bacteroides reticulotermitis]
MVTNKKIIKNREFTNAFCYCSKNLVIEIEKLMVHQSATKKGIFFGLTIFFGL